jgi:hypothetical protein
MAMEAIPFLAFLSLYISYIFYPESTGTVTFGSYRSFGSPERFSHRAFSPRVAHEPRVETTIRRAGASVDRTSACRKAVF